jgi:hypothetical protein
MFEAIILYTKHCKQLNDNELSLYPGLYATDLGLVVEFFNKRVLNLYGLEFYELTPQYGEIHDYTRKLDKSLVNPLELQYLSEKFKGRDYEDYSKPVIEYLKSTGRLTDNDYIYFMNRLKWTYDVVNYGHFDFREVPVEWGALPGQDLLVFVGREGEIIEIYSGYNRKDEYRYETIVDRKQLNINKIDEKYMAKFRRFVFG